MENQANILLQYDEFPSFYIQRWKTGILRLVRRNAPTANNCQLTALPNIATTMYLGTPGRKGRPGEYIHVTNNFYEHQKTFLLMFIKFKGTKSNFLL